MLTAVNIYYSCNNPLRESMAYNFGERVNKLYDTTNADIVVYTSPVLSCINSSRQVLSGLGKSAHITASTFLSNCPESIQLDAEEYPELARLCKEILEEVGQNGITEDAANDFEAVALLYGVIETRYFDTGKIDESLKNKINEAGNQILNIFCGSYDKSLIKGTLSLSRSNGLTICSTHSIILFTLAKYYQNKYCDEISDLNYTHGLSSLIIEHYDDGRKGVFYHYNYSIEE